MDLFSAALGYAIKALTENAEAKQFKDDFFGAFVNWVRPVFLKDDKTAETVLKTPGGQALKEQIIQQKLEKLWEDAATRSAFEDWVHQLQASSTPKEKHVLRDVELEMEGDIEIGDQSPDTGQYDRKGIIENSKIKGKNFRMGDG